MKKAICLFAGCGGDAFGLHSAGIEVVACVEQNADAMKSHAVNFPNCKEFLIDIRELQDKAFDEYRDNIFVMTGGFPCQGFSLAGQHKQNDERNDLYLEFVRLAKHVRPQWVIGENVKGMKEAKRKEICEKFDAIGYEMSCRVLCASDYGVPQERERVIFIGSNRHFPFLYRWPFPYEYNCSVQPLSIYGVLDKAKQDGCIEMKFDDKVVETLNIPGGVRTENVHGCLKHYVETMLDSFSYENFQTQKTALILNIHKPCKTILCAYSWRPKLFVPIKCSQTGRTFLRTLTVQELKQIQGFPVNFSIVGKDEDSIIRQIGNALPPPLICILAKALSVSMHEQEQQWLPLRNYATITTNAWNYEVTLERRRHVFKFNDRVSAEKSRIDAHQCYLRLSSIHPRNNLYLHHHSIGKICLRLKNPNELPNKEWCDTERKVTGRKRKRIPENNQDKEHHYVWLAENTVEKLKAHIWYWHKGSASTRVKTENGQDTRIKLSAFL